MVEIIPKPTEEKPFTLNLLFYFSLVLVIVAVLSIFVLNNFHQKANLTLQNLEADLITRKGPQETALEKEILDYQKKINNFVYLLNTHLNISNFFGFFEELCHPQVWFSKFDFDSQEFEIKVSGQADSFQALGQQLIILKKEEQIKNINLSGVSIEKEGKIGFNLTFSLDPQILKQFKTAE